jgi:myo-inositol-1(or 4)-monophosphatase
MERELLASAISAAKTAGSFIREGLGRNLNVEHKGTIDLVTEVDLQCEKYIFAFLHDRHPSIGFLSEEGTEADSGSDSCWIVDPVDGTTNLAHGYPHVAVSIGLKLNGLIQAGVVYNPFREELFIASRGEGAFLNDTRITVSREEKLGDSLLSTGFPYSVRESPALPLTIFSQVVPAIQGIRRDGAAAVDLCYVACGRVDGFWEVELKPWDTAAGVLLIREAGGMVTDFEGNTVEVTSPRFIATNGKIHDELRSLICTAAYSYVTPRVKFDKERK